VSARVEKKRKIYRSSSPEFDANMLYAVLSGVVLGEDVTESAAEIVRPFAQGQHPAVCWGRWRSTTSWATVATSHLAIDSEQGPPSMDERRRRGEMLWAVIGQADRSDSPRALAVAFAEVWQRHWIVETSAAGNSPAGAGVNCGTSACRRASRSPRAQFADRGTPYPRQTEGKVRACGQPVVRRRALGACARCSHSLR
jgi:hypothetical protein